jgi:hypothetical protein
MQRENAAGPDARERRRFSAAGGSIRRANEIDADQA